MKARLCDNGCGKPAVFFYRKGRNKTKARRDRDHTLCPACYRNQFNALDANNQRALVHDTQRRRETQVMANDIVDAANAAQFDFSAYDEFLKDAEKDTAVGPQEFVVASVTHDQWPSGDPRIKVLGNLTSAPGNPKADITFSEPPAPEVLKAESATMESGKKRGIANTINMYKQLAQHYGKSPKQIKEGDVLRVQVTRDKRNPDGSGGFLRVRAFLSKDHAVGGQTQASGTAPTASPF